MRRYETTFIVNPQADDATIDQQVKAVIGLIEADGGKLLHEDRIGTRRLAYPIAGFVQGFYSSLIFEAETSVLDKLDRFYKLEEPYIRYLTIRYEGGLPQTDEAEEPGEKREASEEKPKAEASGSEEKPASTEAKSEEKSEPSDDSGEDTESESDDENDR